MTVRQALAPGGSSAVAVLSNGVEVNGEPSHTSSWEEWFLHASPRQRSEALGLAQQQGVLYPHQFPAIRNGVSSNGVARETAVASLLSRLLAGKADALSPLVSETITFIDAALDDVQQQAVIRAISTPDVFLLDGLPGAGKSRVVAEIILQAALRGRRILFLAPHTASLDVVLARLVDRSAVFPLRLGDPLEKIDTLPPALRAFSVEEQRHALLERTLAGARRNRERHDEVCQARGEQAPVWDELRACVDRSAALAEQERQCAERTTQLAAAVDKEVAAQVQQMRDTCDNEVRQLESSLQAQQAALAEADKAAAERTQRIAALESAYQAKKQGRFWSLAYWFGGDCVVEMERLLAEQEQARQHQAATQQQFEQTRAQVQTRRERLERDRQALVSAEVDARRRTLQLEHDRLTREKHDVDQRWSDLCAKLQFETPIEKTDAAITTAHEAWLERAKQDDRRCQFAQAWLQFVEQSGTQLAARLPALANLVASTVSRWQSDAKFREGCGGPFDLVILEDAETLTDADVVKLARHGTRAVLVAQALAEPPPHEKPVRSILTAAVPSTSACHRLWHALGGEAGRWPCTWRRENDRLLCQLVPIAAEDMQHLETEGVIDAADIELRILHRPRSTPRLAQVSFGPQHSFEDAFRFMVSDVQEFPLEPLGQTSWWSEDDQCVRRHLGPAALRGQTWLTVEPGLRLGVAADEPTRIAAIEFERGAGWDRAKADDWLGRHRSVHDAERTTFLQMPYRFGQTLAPLVRAVVRPADWLPGCAQDKANAGCEFVAVPSIAGPDWPREGAGLELDLTATKQADRLPAGLRHGLPLRGYVNYPEAQALVKRLEEFADEAGGASIAVLALYQGQVELLRRLIQQSEILRSRPLTVDIALPSRWKQRECDVVLLSLTRSHASRAVCLGEDLIELPLALTRSCGRLIVFGDPGTLGKRAAWTGPLDHLDARAAHEETQRMQRLVAFLQAQ